MPRLNGKLWETASLDELNKPTGSRIVPQSSQLPPVPPPKTDVPASPVSSKYDHAPLPSPLNIPPPIGARTPSGPASPAPPPRGLDDSAPGSPLVGSRRGEALSRSVSHSPSIAVGKARTDSTGGSSVGPRTPELLRREAGNKSPMKPREDLPLSASGSSPQRVAALAAYDSDGGSRRDGSDNGDNSDEEKADRIDKGASAAERRKHVVLEILHTERDYVKDLELLLDVRSLKPTSLSHV